MTYVNALKYFDTNYIINFRFYRCRKIFEKKIFKILVLISRRINEKKIVYDSIFVIMNDCIKIIKYISLIVEYL